jgi:acyl-coenzyme A thioesterase PaaI-like protein
MSSKMFLRYGWTAMTQIPEFTAHSRCFACGGLNTEGLGLIFEKVDNKVFCRTSLDSRFQSYDGIVHGGILASIADATMINLVHEEFGGRPLTGRLEIRYKASIHVGDEITVEASIVRAKIFIVWAYCRIAVGNRLCAEANATFKINQEIRS